MMQQRTWFPAFGLLVVFTLLVGCVSEDATATATVSSLIPVETVATAVPMVEPTIEAVSEATPVLQETTEPETTEPETSETIVSDAEAEPVVALQWEEGPVTFKSDSLHGNMTASGEPFDKDSFTAAHKVLPFGTQVTVINLFNGKRTTVRINDRLPLQVSAVIDLAPAAAREIDMIDAGIVQGRIEWHAGSD